MCKTTTIRVVQGICKYANRKPHMTSYLIRIVVSALSLIRRYSQIK